MFRTIVAPLIVAAGLGAVAGCDGGPTVNNSVTSAESENGPLAQIGALYAAFTDTQKKPPSGIKDFASFAESMPEGVQGVRSGNLVVIWSVKLDDTTPGGKGDSADEVLAYEKSVPDSGGFVLMKNRTIRKMTADEFKAAPKAAGTIEDPAKAKVKKS
ncbi:hypothetical protein [Paludisphaera rhizosphaerae]|uniref:hypothetical protein n=1 Tax=Paludisphaera rhizosphaerae TaxID=2711216 RepID=UPI0013ED1758|nr:hypothetical protein [Paludisphaera rhizosphaerae]